MTPRRPVPPWTASFLWTTRSSARCRASSSASIRRLRGGSWGWLAGSGTRSAARCRGRCRAQPPPCGSCSSGCGTPAAPSPASTEPSSATRKRWRRCSTRTSSSGNNCRRRERSLGQPGHPRLRGLVVRPGSLGNVIPWIRPIKFIYHISPKDLVWLCC